MVTKQHGQPEDSPQPTKAESPALFVMHGIGDGSEHLPWPLEAQRRKRAGSLDTNELDAFLQKQAARFESHPPTEQELLKIQIWGHIRPHVVWPKKHSEEWRAEKIKEIEARVGRKANLGKLLTSQVRKERNERNDMEERMA
jgi:hypothetical protein